VTQCDLLDAGTERSMLQQLEKAKKPIRLDLRFCLIPCFVVGCSLLSCQMSQSARAQREKVCSRGAQSRRSFFQKPGVVIRGQRECRICQAAAALEFAVGAKTANRTAQSMIPAKILSFGVVDCCCFF
jgi:hypothetical protein